MTTKLSSLIEVITPEIAQRLLDKNTNNRKPRKLLIKQIASDMREGRWKKTHQGIMIASDGTLLDGQHRLLAVLDYGFPVEMAVIVDDINEHVENAIQLPIDTGNVRGVHDLAKTGKDLAAVTSQLCKIVNMRGSKTMTAEAVHAVQPYYDRLVENARGNRVGMTSTIRAIAIYLMMINPTNQDYIANQYTCLHSGDFLNMSKSVMSLYRYLTSGKRSTYDVYTKAIRALDPRYTELTKLYKGKTEQRDREHVKKILFKESRKKEIGAWQ